MPQTLHDWVKKHEIDASLRDGITSEERDRIKALECEVMELRRANEILKLASAIQIALCACPTRCIPPAEAKAQYYRQLARWFSANIT